MKLKINKEFAEKYNARKEKEELQRLKRKYKDVEEDLFNGYKDSEEESSSGSSGSEDDDGKDLTNEKDKCILKALAAIKSKDPRCYDPNYNFYGELSGEDEEDEDSDEDEEDGRHKATTTKEKKQKAEKPIYLKDYERMVITERNGILSDEESHSDREDKPKPVDYYKEQELIRKSIKEISAQIDEDDDEDLFRKTEVHSTDKKKRKGEDHLEWLKGLKEDIDENLAKDLDPLRKSWMDPNLDEGQKFLRDYFLNQRYKDVNDSDVNEDEIINEAEEDEKEFEAEELFVRKVDFRFEEPDKEFIKQYPRTIGDSMRNKDNRRSEKRKLVNERKLKEKEKENEELKRLKNLKKKDLLEKLEKLKNITGNDSVSLNEDELEDDFDPAKHDALMEKLIGEDYYDQDDDDKKPTFSRADFDEDDFAEEDWDKWDGAAADDSQNPNLSSEEPQPSTSKENHPSVVVDNEVKVPKKKKVPTATLR